MSNINSILFVTDSNGICAVTVTNNIELILDTDYTVSYSNNINAGEATITITGKGKWTGFITKTFTISPKDISSEVTLEVGQYDNIYSGTAKEPVITVKLGDETLTLETDYEVEYSNNVYVGTATATVTFKGNYTGTVSVNFEIIQDPKTGSFDGEWVTIGG